LEERTVYTLVVTYYPENWTQTLTYATEAAAWDARDHILTGHPTAHVRIKGLPERLYYPDPGPWEPGEEVVIRIAG
jgi:hypothetical protein